MNNFDTVRLALTFDGWTPDDDEHRRWIAKALTALAQIEADHYSAADMADAQAKAFRAGVASVTAGQEPVGWFEPPHGAFRANPMLKIQFPPSTLNWQIPVYTAAPVAQQPQAEQALKDALYALQVPHVACQDGLVARCMCRKCVVKRGDEVLSAPQQAEAVPPDVVRDAERYRWLRNESWAGYNTGKGTPSVYTVDGAGNRRMMLAEEAMDEAIDAAIAQQKGGV